MTVREHVPLSSLTTFKVGGPARYLIECADANDVRKALSFANEQGLPWRAFGGGSNILASDKGFDGVLIRVTADTYSLGEEGIVVADAGMEWDALVRKTCEKGLWGFENLAGIPGSVGAAPVQNVGAYGAEIKDTLEWVEAVNGRGELTHLTKEECGFGYRDSRFKHEPFIILRASWKLSVMPVPKLSYKDLAAKAASGEVLDTPSKIADAVRAIRAKKFPDLREWGTAGSFFKNPVISEEAFAVLEKRYPDVPSYAAEGGRKVPLAWILDRVLALRGYAGTHARLFEAQPLVIVADAGATAGDVMALASDVAARVNEATGIELEWEVQRLP
jgi:UDP-N-acetylmuramate dehydrogenase